MSESDFTDIGRLIKLKEAEIIRRTNTGFHDNLNFRKLKAIFSTYKNKRPLSGSISVIIEQIEVENLIEDCSDLIFDVIDKCISKANNHVFIDRCCNLLSSTTKHYRSTSEARRLFLEMSKQFCVIVIKPEDIHYFINGDDVGEVIFFTKTDEARFKQRKDVSQINEIFDDYRVILTVRDTYHKFFVSNSGKSALYKLSINNGSIPKPIVGKERKQEEAFMVKYQHLLENKPEDRFREDLRKYLDDQLKGTVETTKEHLLENFKRIDILITDEYGDLYLIEVKWVGTSIHAKGDLIGTSFKDSDINPDAIVQTIDYLIELHKNKKHIKSGYLAVFDARTEALQDTVEFFDESILSVEQSSYRTRFKKLKDFRVLNKHPN